VKEGDVIRWSLSLNTLDPLLLFTQKGYYYLLPVHQIPEFKWKDTGTAIVNVLPMAKDDRIVGVVQAKTTELTAPAAGSEASESGPMLVFVTRRGQVKRTPLVDYATNRNMAIAACKVAEGDEVIRVFRADEPEDLLLVSSQGMSIRFNQGEVSLQGRVAGGVRGMMLKENDHLVDALPVTGDEGEILVLSDLGYAKRSLLLDYPQQGRGGKGIQTFEFKEGKRVRPNGSKLVAAFHVKEAVNLIAMTLSASPSEFSSESAPLDDRKGQGKQVTAVERGDLLSEAFKKPLPLHSGSTQS
jgi:topoisomerase-4 subunit A